MKTWTALVLVLLLALAGGPPASAVIPPTPAFSPSDLALLLPSPAQLPAGMVMTDEGTRSAGEIAATFPDPADAGQVLARWQWLSNAYRVYAAGPGAPRRLEVSLHRFANNTGAAYALPYFAHGRAVALDQEEGPVFELRPCEAIVSRGGEVTRYLRLGDLLARVTAVAGDIPAGDPYLVALDSANAGQSAVMANAGWSYQMLDQTCR